MTSDTSLREELFEHVERFDFVQAVRLLQALFPERARVGGFGSPGDELVRFRSEVSLRFPSADLIDLEPPDAETPARLEIAFMGLATPASFGSLPRRYAEEILALARSKNHVLRDFIDLFNHRLISLFFRARERHYPVLLFERGRESPFEKALAGLLGLATPGLADRLALPDRALFARAGLLAMRPMPAHALQSLLCSVFQVPVEVEQFREARFELEPDERNRLGQTNVCLGRDFFVGSEVKLADVRFRVRLGPLSRDQYESLLPDRPSFRELSDLIRFATRGDLEFDVVLVLAAGERVGLKLGSGSDAEGRLGWSSWLGSGAFDAPRSDAVVDPAHWQQASSQRKVAA